MNPKFHALHYNFVAKRLRENYPTSDLEWETAYPIQHDKMLLQRRMVENIAMDFARKFKEDNPSFDPLKFLDQCSPDPELYPFSELWEDGQT